MWQVPLYLLRLVKFLAYSFDEMSIFCAMQEYLDNIKKYNATGAANNNRSGFSVPSVPSAVFILQAIKVKPQSKLDKILQNSAKLP